MLQHYWILASAALTSDKKLKAIRLSSFKCLYHNVPMFFELSRLIEKNVHFIRFRYIIMTYIILYRVIEKFTVSVFPYSSMKSESLL